MTIQFESALTLGRSAVCLLIVACGVRPAVAQECCEISADPTSVSTLGQLDNFGTSVASDGNTAVVGAPLNNDQGIDAGKAFVFAFNAGTNTWDLQLALTAFPDAFAGDEFGHSVAISGDFIVVGARKDDHSDQTDAGSAYIFDRNAGGPGLWGLVAKLTVSDAAMDDELGTSVAFSGDVVVVGAIGVDVSGQFEAGAAYVFKKPPGGWANMTDATQRITASGPIADDHFGRSVSIDAELIIVGAAQSGVNAGAAYVFRFNTGSGLWQEARGTTTHPVRCRRR